MSFLQQIVCTLFNFFVFLFHCSACSSSAVCSECCHPSPVQSAVILKNLVCQNALTPGATVTVTCQNMVQASKANSHGHGRVYSLKSNNEKSSHVLKFSKSLSDMDQKAQNTIDRFSCMERTCSEGRLTQMQEQCLRLNICHKEKKSFSFRPFTVSNGRLSYFWSLSTNYSSTSLATDTHSAVRIPLLEDKYSNEISQSKDLLQYLFSFSHSSKSSSHELDNKSSCLRPEKSSSGMVESTGFCSDDMGDDDVFEENSMRLKITALRAPLCSTEKDNDLDCPSQLSENFPPLSPVSVSGDVCRLVYAKPLSLPPPRSMVTCSALFFFSTIHFSSHWALFSSEFVNFFECAKHFGFLSWCHANHVFSYICSIYCMYKKKGYQEWRSVFFLPASFLKIPISEKYVVLHILEQLNCLPLKQISTPLVPSTLQCIIAFSPLCTSLSFPKIASPVSG